MIKNVDNSEETVENSPKPARGLDLSPTQVIAGGGAAAVASVIGGQLGLGGTVIGAFVLSVITAVAVPLFRTSLEKSHAQLMRVVPRRGQDPARTAPPQATDTARISRATSSKVSLYPFPPAQEDKAIAKAGRSLPNRARVALGAAAIFIIGLGTVVGVQAATGTSLSNGTAALQTGISQVASNAANTRSSPEKDPVPSARAVDPGTAPTEGASSPARETTASPAPTGKASSKQTAPAGKQTSEPSAVPTQAVPATSPASGPYGTNGQVNQGPGVPTPGGATK